MIVKSVAVIGAGVSGLASVKACLEQGLDVTCFEMHSDIGGLWYYTKQSRPDEGATTYDFLYTNTSRETMRFSDFHFPPDAPPFPTRKGYHNYLRDYAEHFGLYKKVELNTKVLGIHETHNYSQPGGWAVEIQQYGETETEIREFGAIIISCGYHRKAVIPEIEGLKRFKGKWSHTQTFKTAKPFERKRVLVIGNGNSALDVATGISKCAEQVYVSIGKGCWVFPRYVRGMTWDQYLYRRYHYLFPTMVDLKWRNICEDYFNHVDFGTRPSKGPLSFFPTVNDEIGSCIANGTVKIVPRAVKFLYDGVQLEDGTNIRNIDDVVFATGFQPDHSLTDEEYLKNSYKDIFPINLQRSTLAFVGMVSTTGPFPPLAEIQSRFVSLVFAGKHKLPSKSQMELDVKKWREIRKSYFGPDKNWTPSLLLIDEIAKEIGVFPSFRKLLLKNPRIALQSFFGPAYSAQYRLIGEGSTDSAMDDCLKAWELTTQGIKLRKVPELTSGYLVHNYRTTLAVLFVLALILAFLLLS